DEPLLDWVAFSDEYVEEMMRLEGRGAAADECCPTCPLEEQRTPLYRCKACTGWSMYCSLCIVRNHTTRPFCHVEEWRDGCFHRATLADLGLTIQLEHPDDEACPHATLVHKDFAVLDLNGIHECAIRQCGCAGAPPLRQQLLRKRLFPATPNAPKAACTFALLEHFHSLTYHGKVTMYDYYNALEMMTDPLGILGLKDRRRLFSRCIREWRYLEMLMQGGRGNDCERRPSEVHPGELAITCPACPNPNENLPANWRSAPRSQQYLYELTLAMDACFRLKRRDVSSNEKDPRLIDGGAYMVEHKPFETWLKTAGTQEEVSCTSCSGLSALEHANTKYSKGYAETGKGIAVCARHEFVQPNGVVPLQAGERYANMDYALASALLHHSKRLSFVLSYDIACQFSKNLVDRIKKLPGLLRYDAVAKTMRFVVPKLHILGHKMACQLFFNLAYLLGGARTDGEGVERPWAYLGLLGASLRQMGPGSAADTLEDHLNYWNWLKLIAIGRFLLRKLLEALKEEAIQRAEFEAFTREQADHADEWKGMVEAFELNNEEPNPFEMPKSASTEEDVQLDLAREEAERATRGAEFAHDVSPADFMVALLEAESEQRNLKRDVVQKKYATAKQEGALMRLRLKVARAVTKVRAAQRVYMPPAVALLESWEAEEGNADLPIEDRPLFPPSALSVADRAACIGGVAEVESRLRNAQCSSALDRIRELLLAKTRELRFKNSNVRHQGSNTRARTLIDGYDDKAKIFAKEYIDARAALLELRNEGSEELRWRALDIHRDLRGMDERAESRATASGSGDAAARSSHLQRLRDATGEGRRTVSWIWYGSNTSDPEAQGTELYAGIRVEYCKAYARLRRWQEQIPLLREEMRRTRVSLECRAKQWDARILADSREGPIGEGARAYAAKRRSGEMRTGA
ncbi:hypothetical protein K523DRAFT_255521, partial [Schizophyllum commune Tattone D]